MNSFDARVRYTRRMIETSFLELLEEKPASRITVTQLCERAQINRATFYKHYLDIPDLLEKIEQDLFERIQSTFDQKQVRLKQSLVDMMRYTQEHRRHFMALGGEHGDPDLMTKTFRLCYQHADPLLARNLHSMQEEERKMLYQFLSHGAGAVLTLWIRDGMRQEPEEVAQVIFGLCSAVVHGAQHEGWKDSYWE